VCLEVGAPRVGPDSWLYFPDAACRANRAHEPKNFDPSMAPPDRSMLCLEVTERGGGADARGAGSGMKRTDDGSADAGDTPGDAARNAAKDAAGDGALLHAVATELDAAGILARGRVAGGFVHRVERAYPLYDLGFRANLDPVLDYLASFGNLLSFGRQGAFNHNNMDHSIVMGLRAAAAAHAERPAEALRARDGEFRRFRIVD
jgi:protoporphyrinogen oxidase